MKIALVHDYLCNLGGSERVFQYICEAYPQADIYTLAYNPIKTYPFFLSKKIHTTFLNCLVRNGRSFKFSFPLATYAMQNINLSKYDLVISSSATIAKYIKTNGIHICYCYIPTRAIWQFDEYFSKNFIKKILKPIIKFLKKRDYNAAQRIDYFIAISKVTQEHIKETYKRQSKVIFSPIETEKFYSSKQRSNNFLIISRLEYWKKIDYAIEAFNQLDLPLKIIGDGPERKKLQAMAKKNISFLGSVNDATLAKEYSKCKAVIFTPYLEYGLIPLEANASGTPVICYGKGGVLETMIPVDNNENKKATAVFFYEQNPQAIVKAINKFQEYQFDPNYLISHASEWNVTTFKKKLISYVDSICEQKNEP